jgi:hypothetical protein
MIPASAMPLLEYNITANEHLYSSIRPQAAVLDWDEEELPEAFKQEFDAILYIAQFLHNAIRLTHFMCP